MSQLKLEKHSSRKRSILLIIKLLIILVSVLGCAKNETYRDNIVPDISVNNIKLSDTTSVVLGYGDLKYNIIEGKEELPYAIFTNENKTEILKLYLFYGTKRNEFYQAEISPYDKKTIPNPTKYKNFSTESGVKLGISKKDLIKIKGNNFVETNHILRHQISDYEKTHFLEKYNLPIYFSEYTFDQDKLSKIYFGFEYP
jgi:lipoprotein